MALPYKLPIFNLTANIWRSASSTSDPPDVVTPAQLYVYSRLVIPITPGDVAVYVPTVELRVPVGTDLQVDDQVECDDGDGWFYDVRWTERVHRGFANEYFMGLMEQTVVGPPTEPAILMESGDAILMESGDPILME